MKRFDLYIILTITCMFAACACGLAVANLMVALNSPLLGGIAAFSGLVACFTLAHFFMQKAEQHHQVRK